MEEGLLFRDVLTPPLKKQGRPRKEVTVQLNFRLSTTVKKRFELFFEKTGGGQKDLAEKFEILLDLASTHSDMHDDESPARAHEAPARNSDAAVASDLGVSRVLARKRTGDYPLPLVRTGYYHRCSSFATWTAK